MLTIENLSHVFGNGTRALDTAMPVVAVEAPPAISVPLPAPRFDRHTAFAQLSARTRP